MTRRVRKPRMTAAEKKIQAAKNKQDLGLELFKVVEENPKHMFGFLESLHKQAKEGRVLSQKQITCYRNIAQKIQAIVERDAERAEKVKEVEAWPEGRRRINGVLLSVREQQTDWGKSRKGLVQSGLHKVWMSIPKNAKLEKGVHIFCKITIKHSPEKCFYYGNRPAEFETLDIISF